MPLYYPCVNMVYNVYREMYTIYTCNIYVHIDIYVVCVYATASLDMYIL